jgi:hypothetical protein
VSSQQPSLDQVARALQMNETAITVHYACESFVTAKGHPPAIASIAIYNLATRDVTAFSRADAPAGVEPQDLELDLLRRFFARLTHLQESLVVHWNMNRPEYGFEALVARLRSLSASDPKPTLPTRRLDLDDLLVQQFGDNYAPHGRLESMAKINDLDIRSFLNGHDEGERFAAADWSALSRSCASKAKIIGDLLRRLCEGQLRSASSAGLLTFAGSRLDAVKALASIADRFLLVQRALRKHPHGKPTIDFHDEWDDQYLFKALLKLFFEDVRDEDYVPSYAGSNSRIDYLLPDYSIGVELKHASSSLTDAEVGSQLIIDRERYQENKKIGHLVCIIFDPGGWIANPRGIETDLQVELSQPGMTVTVIVVDR